MVLTLQVLVTPPFTVSTSSSSKHLILRQPEPSREPVNVGAGKKGSSAVARDPRDPVRRGHTPPRTPIYGANNDIILIIIGSVLLGLLLYG